MFIRRFISILILALSAVSMNTHSVECATSKCYIDLYNSIDSTESVYVNRVKDIHSRLIKVIGSQQVKRSKLFVIDSEGYPWAVALNDNAIVLSKGAIDSMYRENDFELGDARASFVIGHELSHLTTEDLFHHKAFVFNKNPDGSRPEIYPKPEEELRADLRGYTFATIAGYRTERLLGGDSDFFVRWLSQITTSGINSTHPGNEHRSRYTQQGFKRILDNVPYFWFSMALAHFGQYQDAQYLLEDHLNIVETEQAYATLGYIHLQRARKNMPVSMAYRYWIPTLLEPESGLELIKNRNLFDQELPEKSLEHLKMAEMMLLNAIRMDGDNLSTHINLAAVYLYIPDKIHRAYASIEDARLTSLGKYPVVRQQLESIYQLIRVRDDVDGGDRWPRARDKMVELADGVSVPDNLLFNLARMLDDRGRDDTAIKYWNRLYKRLDSLPLVYQQQICFRLDVECSETKRVIPLKDERMQLGRDIRYPDVKNYLSSSWSSSPIAQKDLPGLKAQVFNNKHGDSLLALDNHIEMLIVRNVPFEYSSFSSLRDKFGDPQVFLPVPDGQLLSYGSGWSALVKDENVVEIWLNELD